MPNYQYKARNARGEAMSGQVEAASADAVATQLLNNGVTPIDIREYQAGPSLGDRLNYWYRARRPRLEDLILFARQMYTLMHAGVPIIRALNGLADNLPNPYLSDVLRDVVSGLESGRDFAGALSRHPKVFNTLFVSMVRVGESTGHLDEALLKLSVYLEREKETRDRIKQAMRYPAMVVGAIAIALAVINLLVIPKFAGIFAKFGADLPWQTKVLMATSSFSVNYWPHLLVALVGVVIALRFYLATEPGRLRWDRMKLKIPLVGDILNQALIARFATSFALTLRAGVPLIQGLNVVSHAVNNAFVGGKVAEMRNGVERGDTLTRTAAATGLFTPLTLQMMAVGEETGAVDDMLENVAAFYEREVDFKLKNLSSAIEPILIVIIGAMVLLLALGVFLPMWDLASVVRG